MFRICISIAYLSTASSLSRLITGNSSLARRQPSASPCMKHQLPSLLFIGTGHSGSTSLAELLNLHPNLKYGVRKEHRFFNCNPPESECDYDLQQYTSGFRVPCQTKYTFDATASYVDLASISNLTRRVTLHHNPGLAAVQEVYDTLPDVKILLNIRDPVDTMFSEGVYDLPGMYNHQLACLADVVEIWLKVFPKWRFLALRAEDSFGDMREVANQVFSFMGLERLNFTEGDVDQLSQSGRRRTGRQPSAELRKQFFSNPQVRDCKKRLEHLTGLWFPWEGATSSS